MVNTNQHLIGLKIKHRIYGEGVIHFVFSRNGQDYFIAEFMGDVGTKEFHPEEFRVDLLTGWGGYFRDETADINLRKA